MRKTIGLMMAATGLAVLMIATPASGHTATDGSPVATPAVTSPIATPTEGWFPTPGPGTPYPSAVRLVEFKAHVVK